MMSVCARTPTRDTEMPAFMAGRMPALNRVGLEEDLAVGDRDHVGRHERGHIPRLGLDDRQPVSEPVLPFTAPLLTMVTYSSLTRALRSSRRECR